MTYTCVPTTPPPPHTHTHTHSLGPYVYADVMDVKHLHSLVVNYNIDWLVHFSALLSAIGEKDVIRALEVQSYSTVQCGHDWDHHICILIIEVILLADTL